MYTIFLVMYKNLHIHYVYVVAYLHLDNQFFNKMLATGKSAESEVAEHIYDLILELHSIDSSVLLSVLPQLEFKLRVSLHV